MQCLHLHNLCEEPESKTGFSLHYIIGKLNLTITFQNEKHCYKRKNKAYCHVARDNQNLKQLQINNSIK